MLQIPPVLVARYRPATEREVHSMSFGLLRVPRNPSATAWEQRRGTLEDQAIFGPVEDFACACGTYRGPKNRAMVCDRCGVKVTTRATRRQRFGHIDLPAPVVHSLGQSGEHLFAIPVLPAAFIESRGGEHLADHYDELVRLASSDSTDGIRRSFDHLLELLLPIVVVAHEWNLQEEAVLACGMALVPRVGSAVDTCDGCGYPLEGLEVLICPGCGKLRRIAE